MRRQQQQAVEFSKLGVLQAGLADLGSSGLPIPWKRFMAMTMCPTALKVGRSGAG